LLGRYLPGALVAISELIDDILSHTYKRISTAGPEAIGSSSLAAGSMELEI
jgi:hypothetical protein